MADFKSMIRLPAALTLAILAIVLTGAGPQAGSWKIQSGDVTFLATGKPGFMRINGKGGKPEGNFIIDAKNSLLSGEVLVKVDAFGTGISLRDRHMKEKYLETAKYPEARFVASPQTLPAGAEETKISLPGTLTIHGKSRPVTADATIKTSGEKVEVRSIIETKLSDFDIVVPEYAGITVADKVKIDISFTAGIDPVQGSKK